MVGPSSTARTVLLLDNLFPTKGRGVVGCLKVPVSEGNVLAPVWLQPDPTDRKRERFIAMKNNDAGDWDQTPS